MRFLNATKGSFKAVACKLTCENKQHLMMRTLDSVQLYTAYYIFGTNCIHLKAMEDAGLQRRWLVGTKANVD